MAKEKSRKQGKEEKAAALEVPSTPSRRGGVFGRRRWRRMGGLGVEDAAKAVPPPPPARGPLRHRLGGAPRWDSRHAILQDGCLSLFAGEAPGAPDPVPDHRLRLDTAQLEFQPAKQRLDLLLATGQAHRLSFPLDFGHWLLSFYQHRVYAQARYLSGPSNPAANATVQDLAQQMRGIKRRFLDLCAQAQPHRTRSLFDIFRKKDTPAAQPSQNQQLHAILQDLDTLIGSVDHLARILNVKALKSSSDVGHQQASISSDSDQTKVSPVGDSAIDTLESGTATRTLTELSDVSAASGAGEEAAAVDGGRRPECARRQELPAQARTGVDMGMAALLRALKEGKLPLELFEPLGALQRMAEPLEYAALLDRAAGESEALLRLGHVTAFALACLATQGRTTKPFNPLLGETFALDRWDEAGWRFHSEQVSHNPDVGVCVVDSRCHWRHLAQICLPRPSFSFNHITFSPSGTFQVFLYGSIGETYRYQPLEFRVYNPSSSAKRRLAYSGCLRVNCSNGLTASLKLSLSSSRVSGDIRRGKETLGRLEGAWDRDLALRRLDGQRCPLFAAKALPPDAALYYGFSLFARQLNQPPSEQEALAATDTRLRPDLRALEEGRLADAARLKDCLEQRQRDRRRSGTSAAPLWFAADAAGYWLPARQYWPQAALRFPHTSFPPIFHTE